MANKILIHVLFVVILPLALEAQPAKVITEPVSTLKGHTNDVSALSYSPDGKLIASGAWDKTVIIWDADSLKPLHGHQSHSSAITDLEFSIDSRFLGSVSQDAKAKIWNAGDLSISQKYPSHRGKVNDIAFSPVAGSRFVATACDDGKVRVFDRQKKGKLIRTMDLENVSAKAVIFGSRGRNLIVGGKDGKIRIYNFLRGALTRTLEGHNGSITGLDMTKDGNFIASSSEDKTAIIWEYATGEIKHRLKGHEWRVLCVKFNFDGSYLATGSNDGTAILWNVESGKKIRIFDPDERDYIRDVDFSNDSRYLITASLVRKSGDDGIKIWETGLEDSKKKKPQPVKNNIQKGN